MLAATFEQNRARLLVVAQRILGSQSEAEDAVQEAWLRLNRTDAAEIDNLEGWLTTVVARICLNVLRSRSSRPEEPLDEQLEPSLDTVAGSDPEQEALIADSVGVAMLVVLQTLSPAERVAFVLHDMFDVQFDEIASIVGRSPAATRQLASRARRRVRGAGANVDAPVDKQRQVVDAFLAAARGGDLRALLELLDPRIEVHADDAAVGVGAEPMVRGADAVARTFVGQARAARPSLVGGSPGLVWRQGGRPRVAFAFRLSEDKIVRIDLIADPDRLADLVVEE